jgi:hypothetical protein
MNTYVHKPALTTSLSWSQISTIGAENTTKDIKLNKLKTSSDSLNTAEVGRQLKQLLDTNNIDYYTFATNIIYSSKTVLNQLISKPKSWADLDLKEKNMYRRMHKWTRATSGEVEELKKSMLTQRMLQNLRANERWATLRLKKK